MKYWYLVLIALLLIPSSVMAASWVYTSANVSTPWTCPGGVTNVTVELIGAGGSGRGGQSVLYAGGGGYAGQHFIYAKIPVVPGNTYAIAVGTAGTISAYNTGSNAGSATTGFGKTAAGGAGGIVLSSAGDGGAGAAGFKVTTELATDGTGSDGRAGGAAGLGYGAGGGGGSHDTSPAYDTAGGPGASGLLVITDFADYDGNLPMFSADDTDVPYGTVVRFIDSSTITEITDLTYLWDFGDGTTSDVVGSVSHVYAYMGSFTVSLTINSTSGAITETKSSYVNVVVQEPQQIELTGTPKMVRFHVQDSNAATVIGANVTVQGISTSTGNWSFLYALTGIDDTTGLNTSFMYQLTDSLGDVQFLLFPSVKYNVIVSNGVTTYSTLTLVPAEDKYVISYIPGTSTSIRFIDRSLNGLTGIPERVVFHVISFWGQDIAGATITAVPVSTSMGSWDWAPQMIGLSVDEIRLNSTTLSQTTDSRGRVEFLIIPTAKYNISATLAGYTIPSQFIVPTEHEYTIVATQTSQAFVDIRGTNNVSMTASGAKINTTHGRINITVLDTASSITGGTIYIRRQNASAGGSSILVATLTPITSSYSSSTVVALNGNGTQFYVNGTMASSLTPSVVNRGVPVSFDANPISLGWLDAQTIFYGCAILVAVLMLSGGITSSLGVAAAGYFLSWIFLGFGWFSYFTDRYTAIPLQLAFTVGIVIIAMGYFIDYKRETR